LYGNLNPSAVVSPLSYDSFASVKSFRNIGVFLFLIAMLGGCRKDSLYSGSGGLRISEDTIRFDTVFTRLPGTGYPLSVTQIFWITNPHNQPVKTNIRLAGGATSSYRLNINGRNTTGVEDYEIDARDSIFLFVQCTLEANNDLNPAIVTDSVVIITNGREQKVILEAWGWDAHYFRRTALSCGGEWNDRDKPYVLLDTVVVPAGCKFTIRHGVNIYCGIRTSLYVLGTLEVRGTASQPVLIQSDKLAFRNRYSAGLWSGIHFLRGSVNNIMEYAIVKQASIGIRVDSLPENSSNPNLILRNCQVMHHAAVGLLGITARISAENSLFADCGSFTFYGLLGGDYDFRHCTFASYNTGAGRRDPHVAVTNTLRDGNGRILAVSDVSSYFVNSIIYGPNKDELGFDNSNLAAFNHFLEYNLIKSGESAFNANNNILNREPAFISIDQHNYGIDSTSAAKDKARILSPPIDLDILGRIRNAPVDIGAFEAQD
jgi:hypothetical protein